MSTASEDPSSDQPLRGDRPPGPLAILAATAAGGVVASRLGRVPLLLAASAAAYALLRQKKPAQPQSQSPSPSTSQPAAAVQDPVKEWLSRQILREEQAPLLDLSAAELKQEPEDEYHPEAFMLEDEEQADSVPQPDSDFFASLTKPVPQLPQEVKPEILVDEPTEASELPTTPEPVAVFATPGLSATTLPEPQVQDTPPPVFEWQQPVSVPPALSSAFAWPQPAPVPPVLPPQSPSSVAVGSAWALGVDPMPSLNEAAPYVPPVGSLFFSPQEPPPVPFSTSRQPPRTDVFSTAPVRQEEIGPPLFFATEVFQGATFPDEIQVPPAAAVESAPPAPPPSVPAAQPIAKETAPGIIPPPPAVFSPTTPVIQVELASPGEASFDSPLDAAPPNPWQPQPEEMASKTTAQSPVQIAGTLVEAEIILRPRAPTQNSVVSKSKFAPPPEDTADVHFPGPLQSKQDPKPRPTWLSWWRGD